jgi:acyl-CoA synthetase (AMP-forming)/AMP-acid ligase II/acyl carrier protein
MGLVGGLLSPLYHDRNVYVHTPKDFVLDPLSWLEFVARKKVTMLVGPDFMYKLLAKKSSALTRTLDLSHLRICMTGSEPVVANTLRQFLGAYVQFGLKENVMMPVYGMAEAVLGVTFSPVESIFETLMLDDNEYKKGKIVLSDNNPKEVVSCGKPLIGIQLQIRDENGKVLPELELGEIWFQSPAQTLGYFNRLDLTAELIQNSWIHTGDLGFLYMKNLYISGRKKDLIISRGKKIHAIDIENEIQGAFPFVRKAAAVLLVEERVCLAIELRNLFFSNSVNIKKQIVKRLSRHFDILPQDIFILPARTLPVTSSGKLKRYEVKRLIQNGELVYISRNFLQIGFNQKIKNLFFNLRFLGQNKWRNDALKEEIAFIFIKIAKIPRSELDWYKKIPDYGLDSIQIMNLVVELEKKVGSISIMEFYSFQTLDEVYQYCVKRPTF